MFKNSTVNVDTMRRKLVRHENRSTWMDGELLLYHYNERLSNTSRNLEHHCEVFLVSKMLVRSTTVDATVGRESPEHLSQQVMATPSPLVYRPQMLVNYKENTHLLADFILGHVLVVYYSKRSIGCRF